MISGDRGLLERSRVALGVDRRVPVGFSQQRDGSVFAAGDGPADGELAGHRGVAQGADVGEERLRAACAVGPDEDRVPVPVDVGDLGERGVEDGDVVGGGVRSGVTRPELGGEEFAGVVAEGEQRVVAEGVLERRRGLFLLGVADQHVCIQVNDQHIQPGGAGDPRRPERATGGLGALRPGHLPGPRPRTRHHGQSLLVEDVEQPPARAVGGDRPEQRRLVTEDGNVGDGFGTVGDGDREIDQHPPRIVPRPRSPHTRQRFGQLAGERRDVGQVSQQSCPGVRHEPGPVRGHRDLRPGSCSLHLESASRSDLLGRGLRTLSAGAGGG